MKTCTVCKTEKTLGEFHRQNIGRFGVNSVCKTCRKKDRDLHKHEINLSKKLYYSKNKERIKAKAQAWKNANREKHNSMSRDYATKNKEHVLLVKRIYYKKNKSALNAVVKAWKVANPEALRDYFHVRKAALRNVGGKHTRFQIAELLEKQNGLCAICKADIRIVRHRDHIIPISSGGSNAIGNIQLLCPSCNLGKRAKSMEEYLKEIHGSI